MLRSLPGIVKSLLGKLPQNDYPVLNSRLFFQIWLALILDKGVSSMRDLFFQLNHTGIDVDISTFSKANKVRSLQPFIQIYHEVIKLSKRGKTYKGFALCPVDSTIISLTSKLFWAQKYYQVKLLTSLNLEIQSPDKPVIHFGQSHDISFGNLVVSMIPENGIAVEDRGFASIAHLKELIQNNVLFVVRINSNWRFDENYQIKAGENTCRVIWFCDLETQREYRLITNIPAEIMSQEEVAEIYRYRWQIELLWKFLKMHLKLDRLMTKNINGVTIQIYMVLIAYMVLQLLEIGSPGLMVIKNY